MHAHSLSITRCLNCNKPNGLGNCISCTSFARGEKHMERRILAFIEHLNVEKQSPGLAKLADRLREGEHMAVRR